MVESVVEIMDKLQPESGMVVQAVTVMELIAQRIDDAMEKVLDGSGEYPDVLGIVNEEMQRACVGYVGVYNIQGELRPGLMHASIEQAAKMSAKAVGDPPFLCFVIRR